MRRGGRRSKWVGPAAIGAVIVGVWLAGCSRRAPAPKPAEGAAGADSPLTVHLFIDPAKVRHFPRFQFVYEDPRAVADLRREEQLDKVVGGAVGEEACRRLMHWTRDQWEPGRPDPYPPPDARVILRDIRDGKTGGFCAQYCVVLLQAIASFDTPARFVTVEGHEVIEVWVQAEHRWIMFDPYNDLEVFDRDGRALSALGIFEQLERPDALRLSPGNRLGEDRATYLDRFRHFAVWLRNDLVSQPMNFTDFDRYRVWFDPAGDAPVAPTSLRTPFALDLYPRR